MVMKFTGLFSILLINLVFSLAFAGNSMQLFPADEAERDQELVAFRVKMLEAVRAKEPEVFVTMVDQRVINGLHEKRGMKQFVKKWEPQSIDTELWSTMEQILTMGGGFVRSEKGVEFCAPYVFSHFPDNLDIYAHAAIIKKNVPLKTEPSVRSTTRKMLSYDIIKVLDWVSIADKSGSKDNWLKVTTLGGDKGYVIRRFVRSPSDYSACFLKTKNKGWKLHSLLTAE